MEITVWEWRTVMRYFKLPIENDKTLIEKKTDVAIYWELNINCWEWEIVAWEKKNHYARLSITFSEPVSNS